MRTASNVFLFPAPTTTHVQSITVGCQVREPYEKAPIVLQFVAYLVLHSKPRDLHNACECMTFFI